MIDLIRSPASIYNPHQAVWDEGYAAGLAAGRGAVETKTTKEFEEVKLDVAYLRRCLEYHVDYFGRVTTNPRQITVESQVINRVLKAIPTAPASGDRYAVEDRHGYWVVTDREDPHRATKKHPNRQTAVREMEALLKGNPASGEGADARTLISEKIRGMNEQGVVAIATAFRTLDTQIATLQAALEAKDQAIAELLSGAPGETHKLQAALEKADNALWPFKVYHDWAQASGFDGDADVELWANQSQFETDTPELQAGYFRRAAEAYAAIKQAKDSAS